MSDKEHKCCGGSGEDCCGGDNPSHKGCCGGHHHDNDDSDNDDYADTITLCMENDEEVECIIIDIFPVDNEEYIALVPIETEDVFFYKYIETEDEQFELLNIESEEKQLAVQKEFCRFQELNDDFTEDNEH